MIYIRADMNKVIATGHMVRCLSIADAIVKMGEDVTFIVADNNSEWLAKTKGYKTIVLNTDWKNLNSEISILNELFCDAEKPWIIVDSYLVTPTYLNSLRAWFKVAYLDDLNSFTYPVDKLICYAIYFDKFKYEKKYDKRKLLLGCEYIPLRAEFQGIPSKTINRNIKNVLILSGGTDNNNIIQTIIEAVKADDKEVNAVCGAMNENYEELCTYFSGQKNIHIHKSIDNICDYMKDADVAISAGGTTLYELCACGTPTISFALADNQLDNVKCFDEKRIIRYVGDVRYQDISYNIESALSEYDDENIRKDISIRMQKLVDGQGAKRIVKKLKGIK